MSKILLSRAIVQDLYAHAQNADNQPVSGTVIKQADCFSLNTADSKNSYAAYYSEIDSNNIPNPSNPLFDNSNEALILVISLQTKGVLELSGYKKTDNAVEKIELSII